MSLDLLAVIVGFASFSVFLIIFLIVMRYCRAQQLIAGIFKVFLGAMVAHVFFMINPETLALSDNKNDFYLFIGTATLIYGLLAFIFVLCFFGPNETSIRMKIIALVGTHVEGLNRADIFKHYNARTMLEVRLKRLVGAGDIVLQEGKYKLIKQSNAFFIIDKLAAFLRLLYGIKS